MMKQQSMSSATTHGIRGSQTDFWEDRTIIVIESALETKLSNPMAFRSASKVETFIRRIVGWKVAERMTAQLVIDVFLQARRHGLIGKKALIHSDQGSQYAAVEYRRLLFINGFRQSMSRKGNCYNNAQAESFFSRFKVELIENGINELKIKNTRSKESFVS